MLRPSLGVCNYADKRKETIYGYNHYTRSNRYGKRNRAAW